MAVPDPTAATSQAESAGTPAPGNRASDGDVSGVVMRGSALRIGSLAAPNLLVAIGAVLLLRYLGVDNVGRLAP